MPEDTYYTLTAYKAGKQFATYTSSFYYLKDIAEQFIKWAKYRTDERPPEITDSASICTVLDWACQFASPNWAGCHWTCTEL